MGMDAIQPHCQKEANTTAPLEKHPNCHIFDSRPTKLFRSFLPHQNPCKIHFVDAALCALSGTACIYYLDKDLRSACHLSWGFTREVRQLSLPLPPLHRLLACRYAGDHISCQLTQGRWVFAFTFTDICVGHGYWAEFLYIIRKAWPWGDVSR